MRLREKKNTKATREKKKPSFLGNANNLLSKYLDKSFLRKKKKKNRKNEKKRKNFSCMWVRVGVLRFWLAVCACVRACVQVCVWGRD